MTTPEALNTILERITQKQQTEEDMEVLRQSLRLAGDTVQWVSQDGKFNTNVGQITGGAVHIGDRIYQGASAEAIRDIVQSLLQELQAAAQPNVSLLKSVDALVQQVRSRLHDDIQRLHGTMPLWGVDHWVPLGELFVDVNILEELSSSRRSELDDLWQDFSQNPSYRSLDRIGLGKERQRVSGLEVLAKHTNLMVVGKPGSGKTTYLQRVVTECNAGNLQAHKIPVLIKLREFVEDGRDIAYSLERYLERCWQLSATETQLVLNQGRSLVLLDGLDEVTGEDGKTITKQIKRFARAYPQVQMVVTCRTQSQESRFERFDYVEVADFNEPQVRAFAEHWFQTVCADQAAGQAKAQVFLEQLFQEENEPIRELAITPILLSLTCAVFEQKHTFYSKRSKLYEEGLELLLEQWDKSREIERDELYRDLLVERKLELLSYLAVKKFEQEQYVLFEQAELEGYIAEFLGIRLRESRGVLRAIEAQHGLLIERSHSIYSFSHLTFQEYFASRQIFKKCDPSSSNDLTINELVSHLTEKHWREIFLQVSEMLSEVNPLFLLMKRKIDKILDQETKLQNFLDWVSESSKCFKINFNPAAIRSAYCLLALRQKNFAIIFDIDENTYNFFISLGRSLSFSKVSSIFNRFSDHSVNQLGLASFDKGSDNLVRKHWLFMGFNCYLHWNMPDKLFESKFDSSKGYHLYYALAQQPLLSSRIFHIQAFHTDQSCCISAEDLDGPNVEIKLEKWWKENCQNSVGDYEFQMSQNDKIMSNWQFTDEEKVRLEQFYKANELLVDCLNTDCRINRVLREDIEETLFLSIAEIEKRKREKGE